MQLKVIAKAAWAVVQASVINLAQVPLDVLGAVVVPFAIWFGHDQPDITGTKTIFSAPKWLWLWGNQQEGYDAPKSLELHPTMGAFKRRWLWAAWRNRTSNFRFLGWFKPTKPVKVLSGGNWKITTSGMLAHWLWDHPEKKKFTAFGARIDKEWSAYGANFAWRPYANY